VVPEREMALFEPSLANLAKAARRALFHRFVTMLGLKPTVGFARNMFDDQLYFLVMTLPVDASILEFLHRGGYRDLITHRIQEAVDMAAGRGAKVVSLGGYTSILTRDGTTILPPPGVRVTSGNTFTVAVGARRLLNSCDENDIDPGHPDTCLAVVGASGNIGAGLTLRLTTGERRFHRVALVGHDVKRLQALRDQVLAQTAGGEAPVVTAGTDLGMLRDCNAIAIATNTNEPIVFPHHLNLARRTVIADVSVPSAVSRLLLEAPEVRTIPLSGTVAVPGDERFIMSSHTLPGTVFCCAAEAMLLGLAPEETADLPLVGKIDAKSVAVLDRLAERLGFYRVLGEGGFKVPESP
jgi:predicted amino acid dehydrogenase